jgi:hypothetical protein
MEKSISVRVVEWSGNERKMYPAQPVRINATGGVEAAVRAAYAVFPRGECLRVVRVRGPVLLWDRWSGLRHSPGDSYSLMQDGDVVEIQLRGQVAGPDTRGPGWAPDGAAAFGADDFRGEGRGVGPQEARLTIGALLRCMRAV